MAKMFDRLLLFIYSFIIACATIMLLCMTFGWIGYRSAENYLDNLYHDPVVAYPLIGVAIFFLLISIRLFYLSIRKDSTRFPTVDQHTEYGDLLISYETIQNLALKAAGKIRGLSDLKARIEVTESGLSIDLRTAVDGETPITQLTEEAQRTVKGQVEQMTGIPVVNISMYVSNVNTASAPTFKSRVE